jgi:hypothetical protein
MKNHAPAGIQVGFDQPPNGLINLPYFAVAAGYRPCFSRFRSGALPKLGSFIMVDSYDHEEHPRVSSAQVKHYEAALRSSSHYRVVKLVRYVPTFLGLDFPIDRSPHDWRYPSHVITVYRRDGGRAQAGISCQGSSPAAVGALHQKASQRQG